MTAAEAATLVEERETCLLYDEIVDALVVEGCERGAVARQAANLLLQAGLKRANERGVTVGALGFSAAQGAGIGRLREGGDIGAGAMDELLGLCCDDPAVEVRALAAERGLLLVRDAGQLEAWCDEVIVEQGEVARQVREGRVQAVGRLIGAVMARSGGSADAKSVREILLEKLGQK